MHLLWTFGCLFPLLLTASGARPVDRASMMKEQQRELQAAKVPRRPYREAGPLPEVASTHAPHCHGYVLPSLSASNPAAFAENERPPCIGDSGRQAGESFQWRPEESLVTLDG